MSSASIIIPHYNHSSEVSVLLESLKSLDNLEILVIDDKSNSLEQKKIQELIKNYPNTRLFYNETERKGPGVCRNIGIKKCSSDWIIFADSDDYYNPINLTKLLKNINEDNDIIFFKVDSFDYVLGKKSDRHFTYNKLIQDYLESKPNSELLLRYKHVVPWGKLIRKKLLVSNNIQFSETIAAADLLFSAKLGYYSKNISVFNKTIYFVTLSGNNMSRNKSLIYFENRLSETIKTHKFIKSKLTSKEYKLLELPGRGLIKKAIKNRYSPFIVLKTTFILLLNRIPIIRL